MLLEIRTQYKLNTFRVPRLSGRLAYHLGVLSGIETAQHDAEEDARKKPVAKAA